MSCFLQHWELKMSNEEHKSKLILMAHASRLDWMVTTVKFTVACLYQGAVGFFALLAVPLEDQEFQSQLKG